MKIGVTGIDTPDTMFTHQYRRVGVVHDVASEKRKLIEGRRDNLPMPIRSHKD